MFNFLAAFPPIAYPPASPTTLPVKEHEQPGLLSPKNHMIPLAFLRPPIRVGLDGDRNRE